MTSIRLIAAEIVLQVVDHGRSLNDLLPAAMADIEPDQHAFLQQLVYGSVRYYFALEEIAQPLLEKPIKEKERVVHMLLLIGIYQLWRLDVAEHAAVNETVQAAIDGNKQWAAGLLNAILRRFQREQAVITSELKRGLSFPGWLNKRLHAAYPEQWQVICEQSNLQGPMTLRVNQRKISRADWLAKAQQIGLSVQPTAISNSGVALAAPMSVFSLPGFTEGEVSVQDEAAQLCAQVLPLQQGMRVLDACAAPGGKTGHLLETADIDLIALDVDAKRLTRVEDNLARLQLQAQLVAADAGDLSSWWDGQPFDAVLLDAPCSGTGVIRRHPDIKLLRKSADVIQLVQVQKNLLKELWQTLRPGGYLLYATCSILPDENSHQIARFIAENEDAELQPLYIATDAEVACGVQWLPQAQGHDGFYYALLRKHSV